MVVSRNLHKKLVREDKFDRYYACWANNHCQGWSKYKRENRQKFRVRLERLCEEEYRRYLDR